MNRQHRFGHLRFAFLGALGVIGIGLGACAVSDASAPGESYCAPDDQICKTSNGGAGGDTSTGGAGGTSASAGTGGDAAGGAPEESPVPPTFADAGVDDAGQVAPPLDDDAGGGTGSDGGDMNQDAGPPAACASLPPTPKVVYMSADDSNSMGSPGLVRELINIGFEPNSARVRPYEFLNYYRIAYPAPEYGHLAIFAEMAKTTDPKIADFQIAIRSFDAAPIRRPMNFTFLVDTSGSMKGPGITRARAAVRAIASQFVAGDIVSFLSTDSTDPKLDGYKVAGPNDSMILSTVDGLATGGSTNLGLSLAKAYDVAELHHDDNRMNRVVFISDGGLNVGITDIDLLAQRSADADKEGTYFVGIGTGPALSYNDPLMNTLTDAGRGAYVYLDSVGEAQKVLADRFDETMDIAARSVQVELTMPWYFNVIASDSIEGGVSSTKVEPQHLAPNDAMVFLIKATACDPSVYDLNDPVTIRVAWKTSLAYESMVTEYTVPLNTLVNGKAPTIAKGEAIVAFATALKGCDLDAKGNSTCKDETERRTVVKAKLNDALKLAKTAENGSSDPELDEIIHLIQIHPLMQ